MVLVSYNNAGKAFTRSVTFTVGNPTGGNCVPEDAGVSICAPAPGTTDSSPVTFTAGATAKSGYLTAIRIYIDGQTPNTSYNSANSKSYSFTQDLGVAAGTHNLSMVGYDGGGNSLTASETFTVPTNPMCSHPWDRRCLLSLWQRTCHIAIQRAGKRQRRNRGFHHGDAHLHR